MDAFFLLASEKAPVVSSRYCVGVKRDATVLAIQIPERNSVVAVRVCLLLLSICSLLISGCAEGPLWRTGKFVPWVNNQWAEEEKIAETIFSKRERLRKTVGASVDSGVASQEQAVSQLLDIVKNDNIHLMKIEAVKLLPTLSTESAIEALEVAAMDSAPDVRLAALNGLQQKAAQRSIPVLVRLCESDQNLDVRIAATRALSAFSGNQVLQTLNKSLVDTNPAIQTVAIDSLESVTGQSFERDVNVWRDYITSSIGDAGLETQTANRSSAPDSRFK